MRSRFDGQLTLLNNNLIEMGALIEKAIDRAAIALKKSDVDEAKKIIADDSIIDDKEKEIEGLCLKLILNQQPVATDLRKISTALKMITDMERIGDQAADISELCVYLTDPENIKEMEHITKMSEVTKKMVTDSIDAFVGKDLTLANSVISCDDIVDELYMTVKKELLKLIHENVDAGEQAFDLLQIAKYYERIGDHAVNIAEWVIFSITGKHKNKQVL